MHDGRSKRERVQENVGCTPTYNTRHMEDWSKWNTSDGEWNHCLCMPMNNLKAAAEFMLAIDIGREKDLQGP